MQWHDTKPDVNVLEAEYKRLLGFPAGYQFEGRVRELADWARGWYLEHGHPWVSARQAHLETANGALSLDGTHFVSQRLHSHLSEGQAHAALLVAVCAGPECEEKARQLWQEGKPDEYFFLEVFGSAVVEHLVTLTGARLCAWAEQEGMSVLPHYSPGYSGWDVAEQPRLFETFLRKDAFKLPSNLRVMESGMLQPKKSLLAVMGLTWRLEGIADYRKLVPCENCAFPNCQYRRVPYRFARPAIEEVRRLQPAEPAQTVHSAYCLDHNARYSINLRALRKWSQERLQLEPQPSGALTARFRYEGTTCSNLGRPLEFDYCIELSAPTEGYRILAAKCAPHPGDTGHTHMCEYLTDAPRLMQAIEAEQPLLGRPLNDVLSWQRNFSPAGCYCHAESRLHKWGLVLEVLHYALVQHHKQSRAANSALIAQPASAD